ncbi:MAG: hypothetical protein R3C15_02045 [Thermoleophilia bacterium]
MNQRPRLGLGLVAIAVAASSAAMRCTPSGARRVMSAAGAALVLWLALVSAALACSCAVADPIEMLERYPAAFVGTAIARVEMGSGARWTFRVEEAVLGQVGEQVEVVDDAACPLELSLGERTGLFLRGAPGAWTSGLCYQVAAEALLAAAEGLPAVTGVGPPALLVGGAFGEARLVALDARGETVAYGRGEGQVIALDVCPGSARLVELAWVAPGQRRLGVRSLPGLELVAEREVALAVADAEVLELDCRDSLGSRSLAFERAGSGDAALVMLAENGSTVVWRGMAQAAWLGPGEAILAAGADGSMLVSVDPRTGVERTVGQVPRYTGGLAPSPDGRWLAGVAYSSPEPGVTEPSQIVLVDRSRTPAAVLTAPLETLNVFGPVVWLDESRFAFVNGGGDEARSRIYDTGLRQVELVPTLDGGARDAVALAGTVFAVGFDGRVAASSDPTGGPTFATLPGNEAFVIVTAEATEPSVAGASGWPIVAALHRVIAAILALATT